MPYHINDKGEVRRCSARLHCPYGDFETQHYTTEEEGRLAYEAARVGKTFKPGLKTIMEAREEGSKEFKKLKKKADELVLRGLVGDVHMPSGHIVRDDVLDFKPGEEWIDGSYFYRSENVGGGRVVVYHGTAAAEGRWGDQPGEYDWSRMAGTSAARKYEVLVDAAGKPRRDQWHPDVDPELVRASAMEARERTMAAAEEVVVESMERTFLRSGRTDIAGYYTYRSETGVEDFYKWSPRTILTQIARRYRAMASDAERSGVANPKSFALGRLKKQVGVPPKTLGYPHLEYANGEALALKILEATLIQDDEFKPDSHELRIIRNSWPEGKRPWIDYDFSDLGIKSQTRILAQDQPSTLPSNG